MSYGYTGKILRVNLTSKKIEIETPDDNFYRSYMGGSNIGLYYLLNELKPNIDPLSPDNIIVISSSIVTGTPSPGFSRFNVAAKSPLTGCFGEGQAGGFFGPELKFSGYDAVVIKGKAKSPCYIYIKDEKVKIKDAKGLWGKDTKETQNIIRKENNDSKIRVLVIGKGAENLVRYACITTDLNHAVGRNGIGAVMGSKNLKAVAVRGSTKVNIKDMGIIREANKYFREHQEKNEPTVNLKVYGTAGFTKGNNMDGQLPSFNFQTGYFKDAENLYAEKFASDAFIRKEGCYGCPVKCKKIAKTDGKFTNDPDFGSPEYETITSFGSNCGISDMEAVIYANELCNKYTIDSISTGSAISFAMECFENEVLTKKDTDGLNLRFGNAEAMIEMIEKIVNREGLGDILANGVKIAAEKIGKGAERYAMHVKGQSLPYHEPRAKAMLGFAYAFSPIGADHTLVDHDPLFDFNAPQVFLDEIKTFGLLDKLESTSMGEKKVRMFCYLQNRCSFLDCLCLCYYAFSPAYIFKMKNVVDIISAVTGWGISLWEIMKIGEKRINMAKCFNAREGIDIKDDVLPDRIYEPLESGARKGDKLDRVEFKYSQMLYYRMRNWDSRAIPTKAKLHELDLGWVIGNLEACGVELSL